MKTVIKQSDFPAHDHFGVLVFGTRYVEGDERSKTNPGHGYPGGYEPTTTYIAFNNFDELSVWIAARTTDGEHKPFVVMESAPKKVVTTTQVKLV